VVVLWLMVVAVRNGVLPVDVWDRVSDSSILGDPGSGSCPPVERRRCGSKSPDRATPSVPHSPLAQPAVMWLPSVGSGGGVFGAGLKAGPDAHMSRLRIRTWVGAIPTTLGRDLPYPRKAEAPNYSTVHPWIFETPVSIESRMLNKTQSNSLNPGASSAKSPSVL
jgi:hypothetical protein